VPTGPKGEKRPADVIGNAVKVMRIATGDEREEFGTQPTKNKVAQERGSMGGKKRAAALSQDRRTEIARSAAKSKWTKMKAPAD
jgi:hypothetical protein